MKDRGLKDLKLFSLHSKRAFCFLWPTLSLFLFVLSSVLCECVIIRFGFNRSASSATKQCGKLSSLSQKIKKYRRQWKPHLEGLEHNRSPKRVIKYRLKKKNCWEIWSATWTSTVQKKDINHAIDFLLTHNNILHVKILSRVRRLYKTGYWIDNWIYWITSQLHSYNRVSHNYNWLSQLLLSLFRAQDLLQTQLALTGHQLTLLYSEDSLSLQLTRLGYWLLHCWNWQNLLNDDDPNTDWLTDWL
jgi:hypothetical protein